MIHFEYGNRCSWCFQYEFSIMTCIHKRYWFPQYQEYRLALSCDHDDSQGDLVIAEMSINGTFVLSQVLLAIFMITSCVRVGLSEGQSYDTELLL